MGSRHFNRVYSTTGFETMSDISIPHALKPHRWTLGLNGEALMVFHQPCSEDLALSLLPKGFEPLLIDGSYWLSTFAGINQGISFFPGERIWVEAPFSMTVIPVMIGDLTGWYLVRAGFQSPLAADRARALLVLN